MSITNIFFCMKISLCFILYSRENGRQPSSPMALVILLCGSVVFDEI